MVHSERVKYWLSVGAQMSDRVSWLFGQVGIVPQPPDRFSPKKMLPREMLKKAKT